MTETEIDHLPTLHVGDILTFTDAKNTSPMSSTCTTAYNILEIYLGESYPTIKIMVKLTVVHSLNGNLSVPIEREVLLDEVIKAVETVISNGSNVILTRDK